MEQITITMDLTPDNIRRVARLIDMPADTTVTPNPEHVTDATGAAELETAKDAPIKKSKADKETKPTPPTKVTKTELRQLGAEFVKAGRSEDVKEILAEFGTDKLSAVKEEDYPALKARLVEELGE